MTIHNPTKASGADMLTVELGQGDNMGGETLNAQEVQNEQCSRCYKCKSSAQPDQWLMLQYTQAGEEYRHEDSITWKVFMVSIVLSVTMALVLASLSMYSHSDNGFWVSGILISLFAAVLSLGTCQKIRRMAIYQQHRLGVLRCIEEIVHKKSEAIFLRLYEFTAGNVETHCRKSAFHNRRDKYPVLFRIAARTIVIWILFGVGIGWVAFSGVSLCKLLA